MKVQLLSDLHLEFHRDRGLSFLDSLDFTDVDVLILAGDISTGHGLARDLCRICDRAERVLFVAGNHEYYGSCPDRTHQVLDHVDRANFTWLRNRTVEINGIRFSGTTLWFPRAPLMSRGVKRRMNDFRVIREFEPWVYQEHELSVEFIHHVQDKTDVMITHHIPTEHGIPARFRCDPMNHYFCHDMTEVIQRSTIKSWAYGHTHDHMDFELGSVRLMCNPVGYPHEGLRFDPRMIFSP